MEEDWISHRIGFGYFGYQFFCFLPLFIPSEDIRETLFHLARKVLKIVVFDISTKKEWIGEAIIDFAFDSFKLFSYSFLYFFSS